MSAIAPDTSPPLDAPDAGEPSGRRAVFGAESPVGRRVPIFKVEHTILELHRRRAAATLDLRRAFRPEVVWPAGAQSRLVESVLLRMPLPAIHVAETRDGVMHLVDGLQRLTSLFRFLDGELALAGLSLLPELDGARFQDLEIRMRRRYQDTLLTVMVLGVMADRRLVVEVFDRMNAWAPLREDEVRGFLAMQGGR
jgi:hypothetical protein